LRRRFRRRLLTGAGLAGATALLAAASVIIATGGTSPKPDDDIPVLVRPTPAATDVRADSRNSPPRHLVAAGQVALTAYYTFRTERHAGGSRTVVRTWYLYDPGKNTYRQVPYAYLEAAPGMRVAAVLEGPLPASRVGLFDLTTRKIVRWIPLDHRAGGIAWSPDGRKILVTTYDRDPDLQIPLGQSYRTGFIVIDAGTGRAGAFHPLAPYHDNMNGRQDFCWSHDGTLIWVPTAMASSPQKLFYDLNGRPRPAPPGEADADQAAGLSPNGKYVASGPDPGYGAGPATSVRDAATGRVIAVQRVEQLVAWADDTHLIALNCDLKNNRCDGKGEFHNRFELVSVDGKTVVPLTGYRKNTQEPGSWEPIFTQR
jgi:hypothetical protein